MDPNTPALSSVTHSDALNELGAALALAQSDIVGAVKDSANPFFKSKYADLAAVWDACRKPLTSHGLCVIQMPVTNGSISVTTMLLHSSGQWIMSTCAAAAKDTGPQAIGSVITYLRRYALAAFAGVPQIDDDGEAGEKRPHQEPPAHQPMPRPAVVHVALERVAGDEPPDFPVYEDEPAPPELGTVTVKTFKRAQSKPGVARPWSAAFVTLSDGADGGSFEAAAIDVLEQAFNTGAAIRYVSEPSKKDPSKVTITSAALADSLTF